MLDVFLSESKSTGSPKSITAMNTSDYEFHSVKTGSERLSYSECLSLNEKNSGTNYSLEKVI